MRTSSHAYTPRRALLTSSTAAGLFGLFLGYAIVVRPMVSAPPLDIGIFTKSTSVKGTKSELNKFVDMAHKYLPQQAWAPDANIKMGIKNSDAVVYLQQWVGTDTNRIVKFSPFAMIWPQKGEKPGAPPITLTSDSATIEFEHSFDESDPRPGRVMKGILEGAVRITGPDNLTLRARNFHFSEDSMKIWCDTKVAFTFQKHTGTAHGMQIELIPDEAAKKEGRFGSGGIRKITLLQNVEMNLVSEPDRSKPKKPNEQNSETMYAHVSSAGSFSFVLENNVATFEDDVSVQAFRPEKPDQIDQLRCDLLTLVFARKSEAKPGEKKPQKPADDSQGNLLGGMSGDFSFQRLSADVSPTNPGGRRVTLVSPANKLVATMKRMQYDAETRLAVLTDTNNVRVQQDTSEMQSPKIELVHAPKGEITNVSCLGPGWLKSIDPEKKETRLTARWQEALRKYRDPSSGLDVIELTRQAVVSQPVEQMGLAAESILLWVEPQTGAARRVDRTKAANEPLGGMQPKAMLAQKNVELFGPNMHGKTNRLEALFEMDPAKPVSSTKPQTPVRQTVAESSAPAVSEPVASTNRKPAAASANSRNANAKTREEDSAKPKSKAAIDDKKQDDKKQPDGPMELSGDTIRMLVRRLPGSPKPGEQAARVAKVEATGNIDVRQYRDENQPLQMTGHTLNISNASDNEQTMTVWGGPALVRGPEMRIEGNEIEVDRVRNIATVKGKGLLELPVDQDLEGNPLAKPEWLSIWWKEKMVFNGKQTEFHGDVVTTLQNSSVHCTKMVATMVKEFSFTAKNASGPGQQKVEIEKVDFLGKVDFQSERYEETILAQIQKGELAQLTLNRLTGDIFAMGPGHVKSWQRGRGRRSALFPQASVTANSGSKSSKSEWEFSRIEFSGNMRGNSNQRSMTFHDRVQIIYGPVEHPGEIIDADSSDQGLPERGGCLRSQKLTVTQRKDTNFPKGYVELLAEGNAELEGRTYHGRADRVTFDESIGHYTLRGEGNNKASIWEQKTPGADPRSEEAQSISFVPSEHRIRIDRSTGAGGSG